MTRRIAGGIAGVYSRDSGDRVHEALEPPVRDA